MTRSTLHLIAAAALATAAAAGQAQTASDITLNGLIDVSVGSFKAPGAAAAAKGVESGKMTTSWWGVKGTEDLGGGLSAVFALEAFLRADTASSGRFDADAFWARNAYVGLAGKDWGRITFGRNTTPLFVSTLIFNPFGDSFGFSPSIRHYFTSGTVSGDTGWSDSVLYTSPRVGPGVTFNLHAAAAENRGGRNVGGNVLYFGGPLAASFAYQDVKKDGGIAVDDTRTWQLGGSYQMGTAKLFAQVGDVSNKTTGNGYRILGLGTAVDLTPQGKLLAQYGQIKPDSGSKRTTLTIGYDHFLSKRTDLYAAAMSDKVSGLSSGNGYAVGMRHRF